MCEKYVKCTKSCKMYETYLDNVLEIRKKY